jgi:hypothetical protein
MTESFEDYQDLQGVGFEGREPVAPEDEFFHSIYIAGKTRKNHINVEEVAGKFQIRGVEYNLDEVNMVITHTKELLAKIVSQGGRDNIECFSFKEGGPPWYGTSRSADGSPRLCPQTSAERSLNDFCNPCRSQIVIGGIYCKADGSPVLNDDKKPVFLFVRGKGTKYSNVSNYLSDMFKEELTPIFDPPTDDSRAFEKAVVNNKRFVTNITKGTASSSYGPKEVFVLQKGPALQNEAVMNVLRISKQTVDQFNEKFDWSRGKQASGYAQPTAPEGVLPVDGEQPKTEGEQAAPTEAPAEAPAETPKSDKTFSFDDIKF